jgi:hypothetical protein
LDIRKASSKGLIAAQRETVSRKKQAAIYEQTR